MISYVRYLWFKFWGPSAVKRVFVGYTVWPVGVLPTAAWVPELYTPAVIRKYGPFSELTIMTGPISAADGQTVTFSFRHYG